MENYFILAGNYWEAVQWARKQYHYLKYHHWTFFSDPVIIKGATVPKVIKVGTWYLREDLDILHNAMAMRDAVEAIESFQFGPPHYGQQE